MIGFHIWGVCSRPSASCSRRSHSICIILMTRVQSLLTRFKVSPYAQVRHAFCCSRTCSSWMAIRRAVWRDHEERISRICCAVEPENLCPASVIVAVEDASRTPASAVRPRTYWRKSVFSLDAENPLNGVFSIDEKLVIRSAQPGHKRIVHPDVLRPTGRESASSSL